mgnify:FL=1
MTTLLIVDDDALQRLAVRTILERQPGLTVVGEADNGREAVRMASSLQPDIVLMDVHMPGMDGTEATRRIVSSGSRSRVLVLTTFDLEERVYKALRAGASGFLLKDARPEELIAAVQAVATGDAVIAPSLTRKLLDTFAHRLRSPVPDQDHDGSGRFHHLTGREREVLARVASGRCNGEIAEDLHLAETTIKSHVSSILAKIGARTRVQAVAFAYEAGFAQTGPAHVTTSAKRTTSRCQGREHDLSSPQVPVVAAFLRLPLKRGTAPDPVAASKDPPRPPAELVRRHDVSSRSIDGSECHTVSPRGRRAERAVVLSARRRLHRPHRTSAPSKW